MTQLKEIETSVGLWELKKPKAGIRNKVLAKAETEQGNIKQSVLMTELLPKCISRRPESFDKDVPIEHVLDDLEIEDYDKLFVGLASMINVNNSSEEEKKTS